MEIIIRCFGSVANKILKTSNIQSEIQILQATKYKIDENTERIERILLGHDKKYFKKSLNDNLNSMITLYKFCKTAFIKS